MPAVGHAQILDRISALARVAPRNPCAGAAGKLAIAEMQAGLDQPEVRLMLYLEPAAGCAVSRLASRNLAGYQGS